MAKLDYFQDSGSNYQFGDKLMKPNKQVSQFDLSYVNTFTAKQGQLIPCWFSYYYPGDDFELSIDNMIRVVNPPVVPLLSRQRVFFHMFKIDFSQMWTHWESMMKKGWSGKTELFIPQFAVPLVGSTSSEMNPYLARGSLADYLGFNFAAYSNTTYSQSSIAMPVMPFLAYQLIWRDYYLNKNIASSYAQATKNTELLCLFPDSDYDLMIQGPHVGSTSFSLDGTTSSGSTQPLANLGIGKLRYRDFSPDYFTTALPWPMKGDLPLVDALIQNASSAQVGLDVGGGDIREFRFSPGAFRTSNSAPQIGLSLIDDAGTTINSAALSFDNYTGTILHGGAQNNILFPIVYGNAVGEFPVTTNQIGGIPVVNLDQLGFRASFTQSQLKLLWTNTLISEKMARTDGTYGEFIRTFFGENPSHWTSHRATYLGGTYQPIVFSEVLQSAPANSGTLGTVGAKGISSSSNFVGRFQANDFGIAMCIMSIMPDTYYSQGWMREHSYVVQDDYPLPERAMLGMQPVLNKELYYGVTDSDLGKNDSLFGYQSRFDELRYRQNEVHGLVADAANNSFSPYVQDRQFTATPQLNPSFLTTENNIDNSWLSAPNEAPYIVQVANRVKAVRALPYIAPPSAIMM